MSEYRTGYGEDIHQLVEGRPLILGGISIPFEKGLLGHSDADVVLHAISDAFLGSLSLGDIGHLFPDDKEETLGMDSSIILKECYRRVQEEGYSLANLDVTIIAEKPKLQKYILDMRSNIAKLLKADLKDISIKATTNEKLDAIGEGKAIKTVAVLLIKKNG